MWCHQREGKRMCLWTEILQLKALVKTPPVAYCALIERTIDKHGNAPPCRRLRIEG
jgi:hypothetical protein